MSRPTNNRITTNPQEFFVDILGVVEFPFNGQHVGHFNGSLSTLSFEVTAGATVLMVADETIVELIAGDGILAEAVIETLFQATAIVEVPAASNTNMFTLSVNSTAEFYNSAMALTDKAPASITLNAESEAEPATIITASSNENLFTLSVTAAAQLEVPAAFNGNLFTLSVTSQPVIDQVREDARATITITGDIDTTSLIPPEVVTGIAVATITININDNLDVQSNTVISTLLVTAVPVVTGP